MLFTASRMQSTLKAAARLITGVVSVVLVSACAQAPTSQVKPPPPINEALFSPIAVPSPDTFISLTEPQKRELAAYVQRPDIALLPPYRQVERFLSSKLADFGYEGNNLGAATALAQLGGNCMSLALVTLAVAKELEVPTQFQLVHASPVLLDAADDLVVLSDHVRTLLYDAPANTERLSPFFSGYRILAVDYFPSNNNLFGAVLENDTFIAMFYRNLASDALIKGDLPSAYWLAREGLKWDSGYLPLLNLAAIVHRRSGDAVSSEALYRYGLALAPDNINLIANYRTLALYEGKTELARALKAKMDAVDEYRGFDFYVLGREALGRGELQDAKRYLNKFLRSTDYFHPAWFDIARVYHGLGDEEAAKAALRQALTLASQSDDVKKYSAKLAMLKAAGR